MTGGCLARASLQLLPEVTNYSKPPQPSQTKNMKCRQISSQLKAKELRKQFLVAQTSFPDIDFESQSASMCKIEHSLQNFVANFRLQSSFNEKRINYEIHFFILDFETLQDNRFHNSLMGNLK